MPAWNNLVKTSKARELAPYDPEWILQRAGAVLRKINIFPEKGLRHWVKRFGTKWRVGSAPNRHSDASARIIRYIYNQLKDMRMLDKKEDKYILTSYGKSFALEACNEVKIDAKKVKVVKVEETKPKDNKNDKKKDEKKEKPQKQKKKTDDE